MAESYIGALTDYAYGLVDGDFPREHVDAATRDMARKLVLGLAGNDAERAAGKYTGFGSFGSAVLEGDWPRAAWKADSQNAALLAYWMRFREWVLQRADEMGRDAVVGDDGTRTVGNDG